MLKGKHFTQIISVFFILTISALIKSTFQELKLLKWAGIDFFSYAKPLWDALTLRGLYLWGYPVPINT